jgi:hypothetical protein
MAGYWRKAETLEQRFLRNTERTESCWIWRGSFNVYGYGRICYRMKSALAHRVSYELFKGAITPGLFVCHTCDNTKCVNPHHLFLGDQKANMTDCRSKLRHSFGSRNGCAKLSEDQVIQIRQIHRTEKLTHKILGEMFGVSRSAIGSIVTNKRWNSSLSKGA